MSAPRDTCTVRRLVEKCLAVRIAVPLGMPIPCQKEPLKFTRSLVPEPYAKGSNSVMKKGSETSSGALSTQRKFNQEIFLNKLCANKSECVSDQSNSDDAEATPAP